MQNENFFQKPFKYFSLSFLLFFLIVAFGISVQASDLTSTNFRIHDPIVGTGGGYGTSASVQAFSSGNILGSMGGATSASFRANYGFLYYQDSSPTITFDIDATVAGGTSSAPYLVHLGTLSTGSVKHSDASAVEMIVLNGSTNSASGMTVTVQNANGASGLVSAGTPADTIPSATATMAAGTANYGICVDSGGSLSGFASQGIYNTATPCTTASSTNHVATMTTSPVTIVSTSAPVTNAKAEVFVNAAISTSTKAHTDYSDTLTFIATGSF